LGGSLIGFGDGNMRLLVRIFTVGGFNAIMKRMRLRGSHCLTSLWIGQEPVVVRVIRMEAVAGFCFCIILFKNMLEIGGVLVQTVQR